MSDLLNKASLVMVPSGYKEDTVYSVVPTDGSGDLSFTRASNGTRINSAGLVEDCPWNNITNSEKFGNGYWANFGGTITDDSVVAPNGTTTAATYSGSPAGTYKTFSGYQNGQVLTISCYAKLGTATNVVLVANNSNAWDTIGGKSFTSADGLNTTTWTRIEYSFAAVVFSGSWNWHIGSHSQTGLTPQSNGTFYIWGAQLNIGSTAKPYFPTTDRLNVPRLTYQNGGGGCPSLLLEKQSTNLCIYSNDISNASYVYQNASVSGTTITSPDGTANAYGIIADTAPNTFHRWYKSLGGFTGVRTTSIYAKKGTSRYCGIGYNQNGSTGINNIVVYDLETGVIASNPYSMTASIVNVGNGWYRLFHTFDFGTGGTACDLCVHNAGLLSNYTAVDFQAIDSPSVSTTLYVWGVQIEASSYATSYIPTTSSSATRVADYVSRSGLALTNSTFAVNFKPLDYVVELFDFEKTGGGRMFYIAVQSNGFITFNSVSGGTIGAVGSVIPKNQTCKLAFTLNASTSDLTVFINGSKIGTYATNITTFGAFFGLQSFGYNPGTQIEQISIFPSVLTDAECISLTS